MNVIDFMKGSAEYMVSDRPDIYDLDTAYAELDAAMEILRTATTVVTMVTFTSFVLLRLYEDNCEEFILTRKLSGFLLDKDDETMLVYSYQRGFPHLPHILDTDFED